MKTWLLMLLISLIYFKHSSSEDELSKENKRFFTKCYDKLGCVEVNKNWFNSKYRPVNLQPNSPAVIKTEFVVITSTSLNETSLSYEKVTGNSTALYTAGFLENTQTIIAIHDFTSNGYTGWIKHLCLALAQKGRKNFISVDWEHGAEPPFDQAVANTRVVALEVASFIERLRPLGVSPRLVHLVGHGLGAHVAAYVGYKIRRIQKISGLDPTGARFENMPDAVRLTHYAATEVEVLHTDSFEIKSQGSLEKMGHLDFIINNAALQPGCEKNVHGPLEIKRERVVLGQPVSACSHKRSFKYFIESIESNRCQFIGFRCSNYTQFLRGSCANSFDAKDKYARATFGLTKKIYPEVKGAYFLNTAPASPFCWYPYSVSFVLKGKTTHHGYFELFLVDIHDKVANLSIPDRSNSGAKYVGGRRNTFLFYASPPKLAAVKRVRIRWNAKKDFVHLFVGSDTIAVKKIFLKAIELIGTPDIIKLCPIKGQQEIKSGTYTNFFKCKHKRD